MLSLVKKFSGCFVRGCSWCKNVGFRKFFSEDYFWTKANVGPFFIGLFTAPYWISGLKNIYWSIRYDQLNKQEILSDRFTWLYERMLEDEVHKTLLDKLPSYNFKNNGPENILGPNQI
ncbi:hypothetical protein YYC_01172 [Plasmodium yoelii 17X]|uniref:ATP synthase-associated protein n=3 Tax=Plasmodium yoelii TaxID=5861 RepID=A0AAE9X1Y9_PLAYO|nr:ATP synthase-associated protein, putative [Plasmodium yoelii]ETB61234.1 hypothetical protein YYC_01172 [Plasmodium yoelii 17X]WBY60574.1 ATP synthase-associated protein [Plasmodium yoelii yoelii]CDU20386.1 conserved Plasmodium protein, unknown function [Plasmodium yoelii]VTZ81346.1 ATP synthase-associated protein, putative [Plasmodium yoelii]|eukprot:XP_022812796.1 ATP synthase-associated protein, putative [Plasmodium yoelii]